MFNTNYYYYFLKVANIIKKKLKLKIYRTHFTKIKIKISLLLLKDTLTNILLQEKLEQLVQFNDQHQFFFF